MENFNGLLGAIAITVLHHGLKKDSTIDLIVSEYAKLLLVYSPLNAYLPRRPKILALLQLAC